MFVHRLIYFRSFFEAVFHSLHRCLNHMGVPFLPSSSKFSFLTASCSATTLTFLVKCHKNWKLIVNFFATTSMDKIVCVIYLIYIYALPTPTVVTHRTDEDERLICFIVNKSFGNHRMLLKKSIQIFQTDLMYKCLTPWSKLCKEKKH